MGNSNTPRPLAFFVHEKHDGTNMSHLNLDWPLFALGLVLSHGQFRFEFRWTALNEQIYLCTNVANV